MPGPRVLILVENLSVPFDRRVWQECRALTEAGYQVEVICPRGTKRDTEPYAEIEGVRIHRYPLAAATGGPAGYVREYGTALWHTLRLARAAVPRASRFDVVHACNPPDLLFLIALALRRGGARFVFDHHDLVPELFVSRFAGGPRLLHRVSATARAGHLPRRGRGHQHQRELPPRRRSSAAACRRTACASSAARPTCRGSRRVAPDPALRRGQALPGLLPRA